MSGTLFDLTTVHCFYNCGHKVQGNAGESSDAMERHYWDRHYEPKAKENLIAAGQSPERIGKT